VCHFHPLWVKRVQHDNKSPKEKESDARQPMQTYEESREGKSMSIRISLALFGAKWARMASYQLSDLRLRGLIA